MNQQLKTVLKQDLDWLNNFTVPAQIDFAQAANIAPFVRLIRLDEINEEKHQVYRRALVNVYASLDPDDQVRMLYLLEGSANGVNLYFGVVSDVAGMEFEPYKNLRGALKGQLPGINFGEIGRDTSELQSRPHLVCRLLLEKKKKIQIIINMYIILH